MSQQVNYAMHPLGHKPFEELSDTAVRMMLRVPYIMGLYYSLAIYELQPTPDFNTLCINGPSMWVNPGFWRQLDRNRKLTAIAHELGHKLLLHPTRRGGRHPLVWNMSGDYIINPMLIESSFEPLTDMMIDGKPWNWLYDLELVKEGKGTTEGVYDVLIRRYENDMEKKEGKGQGQGGKGQGGAGTQPGSKTGNPAAGPGANGKAEANAGGTAATGNSDPLQDFITERAKRILGPMRDLQDYNTDPAGNVDDPAKPHDPAEFEQQVRKELREAEAQAKLQGTTPGWMERVIGNANHSKINWWEIVEQWAKQLIIADYSWSRFHRREFIKTGAIAPDLWQPTLGHVLLFIDTSGSISGRELGVFGRHYNDIIEQIKPSKVTLCYCDTRPARVDVFERSELIFDEQMLHPVGGGGTDFRWMADFIDEMDERPVLAMCLTDMYTSWGRDPELPFLWLSTSSILAAPYGEVIAIN